MTRGARGTSIPRRKTMDKKRALEGLNRTMERTLAAFDWDAKTLGRSYGKGKWTAKQILGHLTDCDLLFLARLRFVLAEKEPPIVPFDQDAWANRFGYAGADTALMKETFRALRRNFIETVRQAADGDFARKGRHPENKNYDAAYIVEHAVEHHEHHLEQLEAIKAGKTWSAKP